MATARIGTGLALMFTVPMATYFGILDAAGTLRPNIPMPILLGLILLWLGTLAVFVYTF